MKRTRAAFLTLGMLAAAISTSASTLFTEDFSDNSAGPNMALGVGYASPSTDFSGDFTISSGNSRIYLGTLDTDYSLSSFVFEAEMTSPGSTSAWSSGFIGMGTADAVSGQFGEPVTSPHVIMLIRPDLGTLDSRDNALGAIGPQEVTGLSIPSATHLLRMSWNHSTGNALFEFDQDNNGSIDGSFTLDGSDNGFTGSNAQLFVGGGNGLTFDEIVISVPEPNSMAVISLVFLAGLHFRRKL